MFILRKLPKNFMINSEERLLKKEVSEGGKKVNELLYGWKTINGILNNL